MQWKVTNHGSPLWFLANADDVQEVGAGWNLFKVPVTFTKELMGKVVGDRSARGPAIRP